MTTSSEINTLTTDFRRCSRPHYLLISLCYLAVENHFAVHHFAILPEQSAEEFTAK